MDIYEKGIILLYAYLAVMVTVILYAVVKKKGPVGTIKIGSIPSLMFIFVGCLWVLEFNLILGLVLTLLFYFLLCYIISEPIFDFKKRKKDAD